MSAPTTPAEMADWLEREAVKHIRAKEMAGPYERYSTGDEDAAVCRAIARYLRGEAKRKQK